MDGFEIIDYRFAITSDKYDDKYFANWSRPYEYKYVMDFILAHKSGDITIHNTACGGHHDIHNIFRDELDKIGTCVHSDLVRTGNKEIQYYDIRNKHLGFKNTFDFVLNISTIEHVDSDKIKIIENLFSQVKSGGYLVMTFDFPKIRPEVLEPLLGVVCKKPDNCLTGVNSVSPNLDPEFNHEIVFLVLRKKINDIAVFVDESSLFAAPFLAEALDCPLYVMYPEYNNFFGHGVQGVEWNGGKAINGNNLVIIGYNALRAFAKRDMMHKFNSVAVILSDSWTYKYHEWINDYIAKTNISVYCSHDMHKCFSGFKAKTIYHTIRLKKKDFTKPDDRIIITHSPKNDVKYRVKGSEQLVEIINKLSGNYHFDFRLIQDKPMDECLRMKGESHIFIDNFVYKNPYVPQDRFGGVIRYDGALSKSGIEAMMLGCCVMTAAPEPDGIEGLPCPPVVWCSYDDFRDKLIYLLENRSYMNDIARRQQQWVKKYTSYEFVSKYVTQHLQ